MQLKRTNHNLLLGKIINCITCNKEVYAPLYRLKRGMKYCSRKCARSTLFKKGMRPSPATEFKKGRKPHNYKGGVGRFRVQIYYSEQYQNWRTSVFEKDGYRCLDCGQLGGELQADHIYMFSLFPRLRFDINNGQTLCKPCHRIKTNKEMKRFWVNQFSKSPALP